MDSESKMREEFTKWYCEMMGCPKSHLEYKNDRFVTYSTHCAWIVYKQLKKKEQTGCQKVEGEKIKKIKKRIRFLNFVRETMSCKTSLLILSTEGNSITIAEKGSTEMNNLYNGYTLELERLHRDLEKEKQKDSMVDKMKINQPLPWFNLPLPVDYKDFTPKN